MRIDRIIEMVETDGVVLVSCHNFTEYDLLSEELQNKGLIVHIQYPIFDDLLIIKVYKHENIQEGNEADARRNQMRCLWEAMQRF